MRTAEELRDLLDAVWPDLERATTPAEPEGLGLVLASPLWDLQARERTADELIDTVCLHRTVAAADLLTALVAFGPPWLGGPARGELAALAMEGVRPRWPGAVGALRPIEALTLVGHNMRVHLVRLERERFHEERLFTVLEYRSPLDDPVLRGGLQDPEIRESLDAVIDGLVRSFDPWAVQSIEIDRMAYRLDIAFRGAHDAGLAMSEELSLTAPILARALNGDPGAWPRLAVMADPELAGGHEPGADGYGADASSSGLPRAPMARRREHRAVRAMRRRGRRRG